MREKGAWEPDPRLGTMAQNYSMTSILLRGRGRGGGGGNLRDVEWGINQGCLFNKPLWLSCSSLKNSGWALVTSHWFVPVKSVRLCTVGHDVCTFSS